MAEQHRCTLVTFEHYPYDDDDGRPEVKIVDVVCSCREVFSGRPNEAMNLWAAHQQWAARKRAEAAFEEAVRSI